MKSLRAPLLSVLLLLAGLIGPAALAKGSDQAVWIEAWGHAAMTKTDTQETAKRRALINALVEAGLQGGATIRAYTFMDKSNIVADRALMLAKGRVLQHKVLSATFENGLWRVRVHALVGPVPAGVCGGKRSLLITAYAPTYRISPHASAFVAPLAQQLYQEFLHTIERNTSTRLERVLPSTSAQTARMASDMSYTHLTRGTAPSSAMGDHVLMTTFDADAQLYGGVMTIVLNVDLAIRESDGNIRRHRIQRRAPLPRDASLHRLTLRNRTTAEALLLQGVQKEFNSVLDALGCEPPSARVQFANGVLSVPIGASHGITRGALALLDDPNDSFGLLEIVKLTNSTAVLRPIDPTRPAQSFTGRHVYFMEAGL